jgi:hypothetical protein
MLDTLITSKTRIKLLLKFFLNGNTSSYLRHLETEFGDSTNAIRLELNKFEQAGMLRADINGNKKVYQANREHPLFEEIHSIVKKYVGIDRIIYHITGKVGDVQSVFLIGDYANGKDSGVIDFLLVGENLNHEYIAQLIGKAESLIHRKIRFLFMTEVEFQTSAYNKKDCLLLWES